MLIKMNIIYAKDYSDMSRKAANIIAAQVVLKPDCLLGLATGGTPVGTYEELIARCKEGSVDFKSCKTVNLDEYVGIDPDAPQSYACFMKDKLFSHINIDPANTHLPDGTNLDGADACAQYDSLLRRLGKIDLQLLGIGHNGHIAFNEPDKCFYGGTHMVALSQSTIEANKRFFEKEEDVPRHAYSMGMRDILNAKRILLIVSGAEKADILCRSLTGSIDPFVPASILQLHRNLTVVADAPALSKLLETAPELIG